MTAALALAAALFAPPPAGPLPPGAVAVSGIPRFQGDEQTLSPDGTRLAGVQGRRVVVSPVAGGPSAASPIPDAVNRGQTEAVWPAGGDLCWVTWNQAGFSCLARRADGTVAAPAGPPAQGEWRLVEAKLAPNGKLVLAHWQSADAARHRYEVWPFEAGKGSDGLKPLRALEMAQGDGPSGIGFRGVFSGNSSHFLAVTQHLYGFDLRTGKQAWVLEAPAGDGGLRPSGGFRAAASADGRTVAAVWVPAPGQPAEAAVWDGPTGRFVRPLPDPGLAGHPNQNLAGPVAVLVTPDGKRAAVLAHGGDGGLGGVVADLATGAAVCRLAPQPTVIGSPARLSVSADGRRLAVRGHPATVIWDLRTGTDARPAGGHRGVVTGAVVSKDGRWVVTAGADQLVRCWSAATGAQRWAVGLPTAVRLAGLAPDGAGVLVTTDWLRANARKGVPRAIRVADGKPLDLPAGLTDPALDLVAFSPSGQTVAAVAEGEFRLFSWPAGRPVRTVPFAPLARTFRRFEMAQVRFAADGRGLVAVAMYDHVPGSRGSHNPFRVERYDTATGKLLSAVDVTANRPLLLPAFGRLAFLAMAGPDPAGPELRDAADGTPVGRLGLPGLPPQGSGAMPVTAVTPDGRRLLFAAADGVHVFDPADGFYRGKWPPAATRPTVMAFSPDGRRLVTGDESGVCVVWDAGRHLP